MNKLLKTAGCVSVLACSLSAQAETKAVIETNLGDIRLVLDEKKAPKTVANFVRYARKGFYDGTVFHRVIDGFVIQGGGFTEDMVQKATDKAVVNESDNGLKNQRGTIAMARLSDLNSATSQFFINLADNDFLNFKNSRSYGYTVFGRVEQGLPVAVKIGKVKTGRVGFYQDVPLVPVKIKRVRIEP